MSDFEQRRNEILEVIIEAYVSTASPVSSELISRRLRQALSPATIRNVMAELEEEGLLEQPHTSAGRVPTDSGYRYYVDSLMEVMRLPLEESQRLSQMVRPEELELDSFFACVSEALSSLSHQVAFVVAPTVKHSTIKQIELLPIGLRKLLCVLVGQEALVSSHVVDVEEPISRDEAISLAHFLNTELVGLPTQELLASLERRVLAVSDSFYHLIKRAHAILQSVLATEPEERLFLGGMLHLFEQPEFRKDPRKAHGLLRQFEQQTALLERLRTDLVCLLPASGRASMASGGTRVRIGREVQLEGLDECSYILTPFRVRHIIVGGVGVLGPKRMDYRRMRALVEDMAVRVTEGLNQWELEG